VRAKKAINFYPDTIETVPTLTQNFYLQMWISDL